ncbi:MAG TPA: hypothetical protein VFX03_05610, partial [Thermomicrobiales bacterium]|nr:hypothetical protein [Thermomicrobiales bacterium]
MGHRGGALTAVLGRQAAEARRPKKHRRDKSSQGVGNNECAHFCAAAFPPGHARGECASQAAH